MLVAYVDESGQRAVTRRSSDHFVMTAVIYDTNDQPRMQNLLAGLRTQISAQRGGTPLPPNYVLSWKKIRGHPPRLYIAQELGRAKWLTVSSVVVCKRHLPSRLPTEDHAYLYTLRFLMERLSWFARDHHERMTITLSHIVRFQIAKLRQYESILRSDPACNVAWLWLDPKGIAIDQPTRVEGLQLADLAASATGVAFNIDDFGNTEKRYLELLSPRLYRRGSSSPLTSYGLKMHPWNDITKAVYPWVTAL